MANAYDDLNPEEAKQVGERMGELMAIIEKLAGKDLDSLLAALPLIPTKDIKERLAAGLLLVLLDPNSLEENRENEKIVMSASILLSMLSELYRWREMFGSINLLYGKKK